MLLVRANEAGLEVPSSWMTDYFCRALFQRDILSTDGRGMVQLCLLIYSPSVPRRP